MHRDKQATMPQALPVPGRRQHADAEFVRLGLPFPYLVGSDGKPQRAGLSTFDVASTVQRGSNVQRGGWGVER